jgi:acyl carrier protein
VDKLLSIINTILENAGNPTLTELKPEMDIRNDLNFDSLNLAELTVRIESEFNVDIFEDGLVFTIGEILAKLKI